MTERPWGSMDPNSAHQLWSDWTFRVYGGRTQKFRTVRDNSQAWARRQFGRAGQMRIEYGLRCGVQAWTIRIQVEGVPAHDPGYQLAVRESFRRFVHGGWGLAASVEVDAQILAGDVQDGTPPAQLIVAGAVGD